MANAEGGFFSYKHVSFDLWLTLIRSNPEFKPRRNQLFRDYFGIDKSPDEVAAAIRKFDVLTNAVNEKVGRNFDTFEIYCLILDALGVSIDRYNADDLAGYYKASDELLMQHRPLLLDDCIPVLLRRLQDNGISMNILSNTAFIKGSSLRKILDGYGLDGYFAFQAYSDETGFSKPAIQMYEHAYQSIKKINDIAKQEVLHVGDNPVSDYAGAKAFGFNAFLLTERFYEEYKLQPA